MRVTLHTDYALRALIYLALRPNQRVPTAAIAAAYQISVHHLHKVVRALGTLGLVVLHRGGDGGVELAQSPEEISIGAVVRALDDEDALVECFRPETDQCVISTACTLKRTLRKAQEAFYLELDAVMLSTLIRGSLRSSLFKLTDPTNG